MLAFLGPWALVAVWAVVILFMRWKHGWKISQIVAGMVLMAALSIPLPQLIGSIDRSGNDVLNSITK